MKKITVLVFCLCAVAIIYGQDDLNSSQRRNNVYIVTYSDPIGVTKRDYIPLKSIAYTMGLGVPFISSDLFQEDFWNKNTGFAFQFGVDFRKQFTVERVSDQGRIVNVPTLFAVGGGLGFSSFRKSAGFDSFLDTVPKLTDKDGNSFDARLSYKDIKEQLSLFYLDIPLYLEIGKPSKTKTKAWAKIGLKASLLLSSNFNGSGKYTSKGYYYPEWKVELHHVPVLNYYTDEDCYKDPEYNLNPFVLWGNLSAGVSIPLSNSDKNLVRNTILRIGLKYDFTLNAISKGGSNELFPGSKYWINQSNMLGGKGAKLQFLGLEIGIISSL